MPTFDKVCGVVERHFPSLRPLFEQAKLFHLDLTPGVDLPKRDEIDRSIIQEQLDTFFLPFGVVAIEDRGGVIVLEDTVPGQAGMEEFRRFIVITMPERAEAASLGVTDEKMAEVRDRHGAENPGRAIFTAGIIRVPLLMEHHVFQIIGEAQWVAMASKDKLEIPKSPAASMPGYSAQMQEEILKDAKTAIEEVLYLNQPSRFVVEITPAKLRPTGPKIPRSDSRPIYTLLTPDQIKTRFLVPNTIQHERSGPIPHARRRHYRTLRSEKFVNKRGSRILVPATWVGPEEAIVGAKRYRVRLDL